MDSGVRKLASQRTYVQRAVRLSFSLSFLYVYSGSVVYRGS